MGQLNQNTPGIFFHINDGGGTGDVFGISGNGNEYLRMDKNGNLGIGTVTSKGLLVVVGGNVGFGTSTPQGGLVVTNGNVGIGTWTAGGGALIVSSGAGNVGIGSAWPGQVLDVQGTVRMLGFNMASGAGLGKVLTSDTNGNGTWGTAGAGSNYWSLTAAAGNVGVSTTNTVGIGTTAGGIGTGLVIMNGNVGVGTWEPTVPLQLIGVGTLTPNGGGLTISNGNVGIGTTVAPSTLTVSGNMSLVYAVNSTDSVNSSGQGTFAGGYASQNAGGVTGSITASGTGDFAFGSAIGFNVLSSASITASNAGNFAFGDIPTAGSITSSGAGSVAMGFANSSGIIEALGNGTIAMGEESGGGTLESNGQGSVAMGDAAPGTIQSGGVGSFAMGYNAGGTLEATNNGSIAMGFNNNANLESTGVGSIAMGYALNPNTLQSTGTASVAIGQSVQANANNAFALGLNVINPNASSFMVGFNATPTLTVTGTGVGIGTSNPFGGGLIVLPASTGNVGIGSLTPGQALDVQGTVRMLGFSMSTGAGTGKVLTSDVNGNGTWAVGGAGSNYWSLAGGAGNVGISTMNTVGIGTTFGVGAGLVVMNGNVGIGTWGVWRHVTN